MLSNLPLVSIILPVYNGSRFLKESVDSVIAQTYTNWELIIVDDCSTDNTTDIISEYTNKYHCIRAARHTSNLKLPQALNTGFKLAEGELFTWTSDDNLYLPKAIETLVNALNTHSNADIVYGEEQIIDANGDIIEKRDGIAQICGPECIPILSCVGGYFMFRKNVYFDVGGYDTNWFLVEDWQFWLKAYNAGFKFVKTEENYYYYRDNATSLSITNAFEVQARCLKLSLENLAENKDRYSKQIAVRAYLKCVGFAYRIGDRKSGIECFYLAKGIDADASTYLKPEMVKWLEG